MRGLGKTLSRLAALSRVPQAANAANDGRLAEIRDFGRNPGALAAWAYVPDGLGAGAPLVVVLHGCTQSAAGYDRGSGWSTLADRHGFALLFPEQSRANNANLCFSWFQPDDARRGKGEAASVAEMVAHMQAAHRLDPARTFVTGLSAGGAMTAVMLAAYPELFAGGAIIAGLPFASANSVPEALERMRGTGGPSRQALAERARTAAPRSARVPRLSVWHGTHDTTVDPANATRLVDQWRDLHGLGAQAGVVAIADGHRREVWRDATGRAIIERYDIRGMGHGTPLATRDGEACGIAGPHMLEAGICSTRRIADFWGLIGMEAVRGEHVAAPASPTPARPVPLDPPPANGVGAVIEDALRAAGLMR